MSAIFGEKLRQLRIQRGFTLDTLADRVGSTKAYVWQLENKKVARPSADLLLKIAAALEVSPDFLIDDSTREPSRDHYADALFRKIKERKLSRTDIKTLMSVAENLGKKK
jgi:transcriptional regulator with XRE-family HTH domain